MAPPIVLGLVALVLAACAGRPLPPAQVATKQARARAGSGTVVYRRLSGIQHGSRVLDDAVAAMGASCARIPAESIASSTGAAAAEANDGDVATTFNSGAFGPHQLTIELAEPVVVSGIVIATEQTPDGVTTQILEVSDDGVVWSEVGVLRGHTTTQTVYAATLRPAPRARLVRVRSTESPSWIAFREVVLVSCSGPARLTGDRVPRRTPVDRTRPR
jgi:hypothetical protein